MSNYTEGLNLDYKNNTEVALSRKSLINCGIRGRDEVHLAAKRAITEGPFRNILPLDDVTHLRSMIL